MKTNYIVGEDQKTLIATRSFQAELDKVWEAWTNSKMLDQWWGPKSYDAITESFSFTEGGEWRYVMRGPEGDAHYCINKYLTIDNKKEFTAEDSFANENWEVNPEMPTSHWKVEFSYNNGVTEVRVTTIYNSKEELETVINMGMKEGFDTGLNQLEELLRV